MPPGPRHLPAKAGLRRRGPGRGPSGQGRGPVSYLLILLAVIGQGRPEEEDSLTQPEIETVAYSADSMVYDSDSGVLLLVGNGEVDYRNMSLQSDTIRYLTDEETLWASGEPELFDRGESIRGTRMVYDLGTRKGSIEQAASQYEFGYYRGRSITRVGRNEYNIVDARFTTCEIDSAPHYYFFSPRMKVYPNDKAVCKPLYMYIDDTVVFYFPWMVFPIRTGRQSGFTLPSLGQTTRDGRYLRGFGYYFAFSDYCDLLLEGDILEKSRFALRAQERHRLRYVFHGNLRTEWRREFRDKRDRWMIFGNHLHDFHDGTTARLQGEFISDRSYLEETQQTPEERMNRELRSWLSLSRSFGPARVEAVVDHTSYLDTDPDSIYNELKSESELPRINVSLPSNPLFGRPSDPSQQRLYHSIYYNVNSRYLSKDVRYEETRRANSGLRTTSSLSASQRLGGWLSLSPSLTAISTVYDRDRLGNSLPAWLHGQAGISTSTDLYGIFRTTMFGLDAFRHTITPSIGYTYAPEIYLNTQDGTADTKEADSLYYTFSGFSLPSARNSLSLGLYNSLEAKGVDEDQTKRYEIASLNVSTSADLSAGERHFSPLSATLEIQPIQPLSFQSNGAYDLYDGELTSLTFTTTLTLSGEDPTFTTTDSMGRTSILESLPWRLGLSHNYRLGLDEARDLSKLKLTASLSLTNAWSVDYRAYYDLLDQEFINQYYTLRRDLHCWEAIFVRHVSETDTGFYFRINIKELPDIKVEQHVSRF
ncbi:LPS assembly protein LptD [Candidatus Fermentibacteria bacterium]|nr:LPS assembly protein LptD [Candidatus Fermentibacteria bacterium]